MAVTEAQTESPPTAEHPLSGSASLQISLPLSPPLLVGPQSLYCVIQEGNKARSYSHCLEDFWKFRITSITEVLGYMQDSVREGMIWTDKFQIDEKNRTIILTPVVQQGEAPTDACLRAFSDLCEKNQGRLNNCFDRWLGTPQECRDFHPIHNTDPDWQGLSMPAPARGLFGIVTIGVHLNMYSVQTTNGRKIIDRIWVSQRATSDHVAYSGMLDQVVAGGMDPGDRVNKLLSPGRTLTREASEEAGLKIDSKTKIVTTTDISGSEIRVGIVEEAPTITFYDLKGRDAGSASEGHLEPGVRFVYDLELHDPDFRPQKQEEGIAKFESLSVEEVKRTLRRKAWKPNCGLVMLDFLVRKDLIIKGEEENYARIKEELHRSPPFEFIRQRYPFMAPWSRGL